MRTDDVREAAFLVAKGHPVLGLAYGKRGWVVLEFDDSALPVTAEYKADGLIPVRTFFRAYKGLLDRINKFKAENPLGGQR